jgi:hypothetical protein
MAISFISAGADNSSTITLGTHQKGDLIIAAGYRNANVNAPRTTERWHFIGDSGGASSSLTVAYLIAESSSETFGAWTNNTADHVLYSIYRSSKIIIPQRVNAAAVAAGFTTGTSTTANYAAANIGVSAWFLGIIGVRLNSNNAETAPAGMTNRTSTAGGSAGEFALHDTNEAVSSWSATEFTLSTSDTWRTAVFALRETNIDVAGGGGEFFHGSF